MKNILITTTTRDNIGTTYSFINDINDLPAGLIKSMVSNNIRGIEMDRNGYWSHNGMCGSDDGYIFNEYESEYDWPMTIEHIVNYVF